MSARGVLVASLGFLSFSTVYNNLVVSPVLVELSRELDVTIGTAGLLVTAYGLPGVLVSILSGPLSDRYGRKPFLVGGGAVMSVTTLLSAAVPSFAYLLLTRVGAGAGASVLFPSITAAIADEFPYHERGRAMSTVIAMNSLATIVGVPLAGLIAGLTSWRVSFALVGLLGALATLVVWRSLRTTPQDGADGLAAKDLITTVLGDSAIRGSIASSLLGTVFWFSWITYVVAFFVERFGLPTATASLVILVTGVGIVVGSQIGGRLGDRVGHRTIVGWTVVIGGLLMLVEMVLVRDLVVAALLALVIAAVSGARLATNLTLISELAPNARGTLFAINSSIISIGIVVGTAAGGILIDYYGYEALAVMAAVAGVISGLIVWRYVTERTAPIAAGELVD